MTIKQLMKEKLIEDGLFEDMADEVLKLAEEDKVLENIKERWNDNTEGYPAHTLAVVYISLKRIALKYIDENLPKAFFRDNFVR